MACPIRIQILEYNNIYNIRKDYQSFRQDIEIQKKLINELQKSDLQNNILNLIISMVNSNPSLRYQNINDVIAQINYIEKIMKPNSKNSSNL